MNGKSLVWGLGGLVLGGILVAIALQDRGGPVDGLAKGTEKPGTDTTGPGKEHEPPACVPSPETTGRFDKARSLQRDGKWCEAREAWDAALKGLPAPPTGSDEDACGALRAEAEANLRIAEKSCRPADPPVPAGQTVDVPPRPEPERPRPLADVRKDALVEFYPRGWAARSVSHLQVRGKATRADWGLQHEAHFDHLYRVRAETKVLENRPTAVVFEQSFPEAIQLRAMSRTDSLRLNLPDSPLLDIVGTTLEPILVVNPKYLLLKKLADIYLIVDPDLKKTLTALARHLERNGVKLGQNDDLELVTQIERLQGQRFRLEYVDRLGVTEITSLDESLFGRDELRRLAYNATLFLDLYVARAADRKVGDTEELRTSEIGGLIGLEHDVSVDGTLHLTRGQDSRLDVSGGRQIDVRTVNVTGGDIDVRVVVQGQERHAHISPKSGVVHYDPETRLVRKAVAEWSGKTRHFSEDHLLFPLKSLKDVQMTSRYEADLGSVKPE